jgi:undecaprenyl-diphosphatase
MNTVIAYVHDSDLRLSDSLRAWRPPRGVRVWMLGATRLGDGWLWTVLALLLSLRGGHAHKVLATGALAAGLASALLIPVKRRVRRPRPCELAGFPHFDVRPPDRWSFPSGHSMNAFAVCTVLALAFPSLASPLLLTAASIAASRVVLGLHFVSDVIVGSLLGAVIGAATHTALLG